MQANLFRCLQLFIFIFIFGAIGGCTPFDNMVSKSAEGLVFKRIAVVPFQKVNREDINIQYARNPLLAGSFRMDQPAEAPEKGVETLYMEHLRQYPQLEVYSTERVGGIFLRNATESLKATVPDILRKVGEELQADVVVVGYLYRWRQLRGTSYAAEKPASVAFDIQMFRTIDGAIVWRGLFDHTQASLMENLSQISFFFKEGSKWLTAEELARLGLEEVMKSFPAQKVETGNKDRTLPGGTD